MNHTPAPQSITVRIKGREVSCPSGTLVRDLSDGDRDPGGLPYVAAVVNNEAVMFSHPLDMDCTVECITATHPQGWRIFRNSVAFLLAKTMHECFPAADFALEHSLGTGFYCRFALEGKPGISDAQLTKLERGMRRAVEQDEPIVRRKVAYEAALRRFEAEGQTDKVNLLHFQNPPHIEVYECDGFTDLAHGVLADRTGAVPFFRLISNPPGFVLLLPDRHLMPEFPEFDPQPYLFEVFREHKEWGRILGLRTVGDLNRFVASRGVRGIVHIAEALHEKKIARIADRIFENHKRIRWILVAGPSSAGKTTFSKRLMVQLQVNGLRPVAISMDDYFVDREHTPRNERGELDFEHIETVDLPLLHDHLQRLDRGEEVILPRFDFRSGARSMVPERTLRLAEDQVALVEGIHALNPRLTESVPDEHKFRIYISALTQLNLDFHNRVATTDNRMLRRMVRDHRFRGNDALATLALWPAIRHGERTWVFPFQQYADVAFNSALDYEIAVLKPFAEPLLREVKPFHSSYAEARRLLAFLEVFLPLSYHVVPPTSLLREFIGRSAFRY